MEFAFLALLFLIIGSLLIVLVRERIFVKDFGDMTSPARVAWLLLAAFAMLVALSTILAALFLIFLAVVEDAGFLGATLALFLGLIFIFVSRVIANRLPKK